MNKLLIITLLVILLVIGIGIWYKYKVTNNKREESENKSKQSEILLTGLTSGGAGTTFETDGEAEKMISTKLLKNSVMSKKPLRKLSDFTMSGPFIGPTGNGNIPIQIIRPEANGAIGFYTTDGQYIKGVLYNLNTGEKLGTRYYLGTNINSATWTAAGMEVYNINTTIPGGMTVAIAELKNLYPNYIREGLFYIKLSGTPDDNAWCLGGYIHKDNDAITGMGLQISSTDLNVDRNAFAQNSFTTFANNDNIKNKFSALPILLNFASKNDNEFSFYMKDIRKGRDQQLNIFAGDNQTYIINKGTFCIIDLRDGRMPWYNSSVNRFSSSQAWYKGNIDGVSPRTCRGDGEYRSRYRTYQLIVTGDNNNTFYIQERQSGQFFCNKGTGLLEASNSNDGTDKMKWVLEYRTQNSCDGYIIRSKLDNRWLRWIGDWDKWELNNSSGPDWAWAIIRPEDLGWYVYDFFRSISTAENQNKGGDHFNSVNIVDAINHFNWSKTASSLWNNRYYEDTNDYRHGCFESYWGNWIVHNGRRLLQVPYGVPGMRIGGTNNNDTASLYTFVQNKGGWSIKSVHHNKYLTFSLNKGTIVPVFSSTDLNQALTFELVPVLDRNLADKYVRASIEYLNKPNTNRATKLNEDLLNDTLSEKFCGKEEKFRDGTLKLNLGIPDAIDPDPVTGTFESICSCNMQQLGKDAEGFYQKRLCSDDYIRTEYGITSNLESIRDTLKCLYPNCRFQKCKLVHNISDPNLKVTNTANYAQDCGSNTMCVVNQKFNVNGSLENSTVNQNAEILCGQAGTNGVGEDVSSNLSWLPNQAETLVRIERVKNKYVTLRRTDGRNLPINISKIYIFDDKYERIKADKLIATLSPVLDNSQYGPNNLLLDSESYDRFSHTANSPNAFIQIELKEPSVINKIIIINRVDCCKDRILGTELVLISNDGVDNKKIPITNVKDYYSFDTTRETPEEKQDREFREKEQRDRMILTNANISIVPGFSGNYDDFSNEKNQTAEMCRQKAIQSNGRYVAWGHRNSNHPDPNYKNTCFLYKSPPFLKPNSAFNPITQLNDNVNLSGCLKEGDHIIHGCKSNVEIRNKLKDLEVEIFEEPNYTSSLGKFKYGTVHREALENKPIRSIKVPVGKMVNLVVNLSGNPETQNLIKGNVTSLNVNDIKFMKIRDDVYELFPPQI